MTFLHSLCSQTKAPESESFKSFEYYIIENVFVKMTNDRMDRNAEKTKMYHE